MTDYRLSSVINQTETVRFLKKFTPPYADDLSSGNLLNIHTFYNLSKRYIKLSASTL